MPRRDLMPGNELYVWVLSQFCTAGYELDVMQKAWQIEDRYRYCWRDCVLPASASEYMQHQQRLRACPIEPAQARS
jgi:hypothetical protein